MASDLFLFLFLFPSLALVPSALGGFSVDLIHRDAPISPLYDSSVTRFARWRLAEDLSEERAHRFARRKIGIISPLAPDSGTYLVKLSLGTPPFDVYAIADTGSSLTWLNCEPCTDCYEQKDPRFEPAKSSSYSNVTCGTKSCNKLQSHLCDRENNCKYEEHYVDGSIVSGVLAKERFTFVSTSGGNVSKKSILFGCSHRSKGTFKRSSGGLVGLGGEKLSLVSQLGDSINNQFSYCLLPYTSVNESSYLVFGPDSRAPSGKILKTPLIKKTYYYLTLVNITVGDKTIPVPGKTSATSSGNIIIDSGSTFTSLDWGVFDAVTTEVKKVVTLPPVTDPKYFKFTCFEGNGTEKDLNFPEISFGFDGANVPLKRENMLVEVDDNILCLPLKRAGLLGIQIYGNIMQQGFYMGYDLGQQQLSIAPANCANF